VFTGLIEQVGKVRQLQQGGAQVRLTVACDFPAGEVRLGDSIAVNGSCLTVVAFEQGWFQADLSPETLQRTALQQLTVGSPVNLERALRLSDRLGGHLVSGHVDAVGTVQKRDQDRNAVRFQVGLDPRWLRYLVEKGSVAIDGISLTVNSVDASGFSVTVIPHTLAQTTLADARPGTRVNIETDLLGKYVERLLVGGRSASPGDGLTLESLAKHGFL